jgi:hypothetical protein
MKKLRNLTVLFLFVLAALGFIPVAIQAEEGAPEAPGSDCIWVYGPNNTGIWSCSWGCDYFYEYCENGWSEPEESCAVYN